MSQMALLISAMGEIFSKKYWEKYAKSAMEICPKNILQYIMQKITRLRVKQQRSGRGGTLLSHCQFDHSDFETNMMLGNKRLSYSKYCGERREL